MAETDILSLSEAKAALNMEGGQTDQDDEIRGYVSAVSARIDDLVGAVVIRDIEDETHSGGSGRITLRYRPVVSIASVIEYRYTTAVTLTAETNLAKATNQYVIDLTWGELHRRDSGGSSLFYDGFHNVVVSYTAGRFEDTASVAPKFKLAASIFLRHLWIREQGAGSVTFGAEELASPIPTFGVPNVVRDLLLSDLNPPVIA